jgi:hypothetical protein
MFDELTYGDIFIERDEDVPYMKIETIDFEDMEPYNAVCLIDGTEHWFEPFDRVFKYKRDIVLNAEDFVGDERED